MAGYDFKKQNKELYLPPEKPVLVDVPRMQFLMVDGAGDPNGSKAFQDAVSALYAMSWTIKMLPRKGIVPEGFYEYTVAPLEGLWGLSDSGTFSFQERGNWVWTVMIRQPEFVTEDLVRALLPDVKKKKPIEALSLIRLEEFTEGLCVQAMHLGPYATEPETMERIEAFLAEHGLKDHLGSDGRHHEIYLTDPNKGDPVKQRTVLRHPVAWR